MKEFINSIAVKGREVLLLVRFVVVVVVVVVVVAVAVPEKKRPNKKMGKLNYLLG